MSDLLVHTVSHDRVSSLKYLKLVLHIISWFVLLSCSADRFLHHVLHHEVRICMQVGDTDEDANTGRCCLTGHRLGVLFPGSWS